MKKSGLFSYKLSIKRIPRILTSPLRIQPVYIIIGAQRCGSTSLYEYLTSHPHIAPAFVKEVHYFDVNYKNGNLWYRAHFPTLFQQHYVHLVQDYQLITGESSPYYIFHPHAPGRIAQNYPGIKIIALLRNPVDRAYSHYQHQVRLGLENLTFEDAIEHEPERLHGENEKMLNDENYFSFNHQAYSYLARGRYAQQLATWLNLFPRQNLKIIPTDELDANPQNTMDTLFDFLNLPAWKIISSHQFHQARYDTMNPTTREQLEAYFSPHNQDLNELLGVEYDW